MIKARVIQGRSAGVLLLFLALVGLPLLLLLGVLAAAFLVVFLVYRTIRSMLLLSAEAFGLRKLSESAGRASRDDKEVVWESGPLRTERPIVDVESEVVNDSRSRSGSSRSSK